MPSFQLRVFKYCFNMLVSVPLVHLSASQFPILEAIWRHEWIMVMKDKYARLLVFSGGLLTGVRRMAMTAKAAYGADDGEWS